MYISRHQFHSFLPIISTHTFFSSFFEFLAHWFFFFSLSLLKKVCVVYSTSRKHVWTSKNYDGDVQSDFLARGLNWYGNNICEWQILFFFFFYCKWMAMCLLCESPSHARYSIICLVYQKNFIICIGLWHQCWYILHSCCSPFYLPDFFSISIWSIFVHLQYIQFGFCFNLVISIFWLRHVREDMEESMATKIFKLVAISSFVFPPLFQSIFCWFLLLIIKMISLANGHNKVWPILC